MDVPVTVSGLPKNVDMTSGQGSIPITPEAELLVDPDKWILMDSPVITTLHDNSYTSTPTDFHLYQNYPNPFNHQTKIKFSLPFASDVEISISNLTGELLSELYVSKKDAGIHLITWNAQQYPSGVYFIHLRAGNFTRTIKTTLLK